MKNYTNAKPSSDAAGVLRHATKAKATNEKKKTIRNICLSGHRVATLTLRTRTCRAYTNIPLKRPIVYGTLKLGDREVTLRSPRALGTFAWMAQADSIAYTPSYVDWDVNVEDVFDEELRAMLEPEDASFVARIRDSFILRLGSGQSAALGSK